MRFIVLICCLISLSAQAQDLSGIWRGHFRSTGNRMLEMLGEEDRYKFEVQLDQKNKNFSGVTYSYKTTVFYGKASCKGTINPATRKVLLEETRIVEVRMAGGDACIMTCFLQYTKSGDEEFLEGTYSSMNIRDSTNCGRGTLFLRKVTTSDFFKEPFIVKKEQEKARKKSAPLAKHTEPRKVTPKASPVPAKPTPPPVKKENRVDNKQPSQPVDAPKPVSPKGVTVDSDVKKNITKRPAIPVPPVIASRKNELIKTIEIPAGKIEVDLYDNGTIDNDTVSVYLNNRLMVSKQRLTAEPIVLHFDLNEEEPELELVMVAENLGEIPPNTSLMVVKAGDRQYEVRITSTEQKNAMVRFRMEDH